MVEIIKRGTRKEITCPKCGSLLAYTAEDVKISGDYTLMNRECIDCPVCKFEILLKEISIKSDKGLVFDSSEPNSTYKEIWRLEHLLDEKKISHSIEQLFDGYKVGVLYGGFEIGDAIEHKDSYGHENDLLEIRGFDVNDVIGSLTADEVMEYVNKSWESWDRAGNKNI